MSLFGKPKKQKQAGFNPDPEFPVSSERPYRQVISDLIDLLQVELYLEIGSRSGASLEPLECSYIAVDPEFAIRADVFNKAPLQLFFQMTSDAFFERGHLRKLGLKPDLCFVDGMHLFEFALRDFMNCEKAMTANGVICLHDVAPFNHAMTTRDLGYLGAVPGRPWTGDVWKVLAILKQYRPDLEVELVSASSTGLGVVSGLSPDNRELEENMDEILAGFTGLTMADYGVDNYFHGVGLKSPDDLSLLRTSRPQHI